MLLPILLGLASLASEPVAPAAVSSAVVAGSATNPGSAANAGSAVAIGEIRMAERVWGTGSLPTLTFTLATGRARADKVAAFLYTSELPGAFLTSTFAPQFVGVFYPPASVQVVVHRPPERSMIVEGSRERFVQGALFDMRTGALVDVTNEDYVDIVYASPPTLYTLDFETEDDFTTPLVNGQDLSTPPEFGALVSLSARQPGGGAQHRGPAIFDSDPAGPNAGSSDPDLLVGLGNAVILQENAGQIIPGIFTLPDDAANGGTLVFDFSGFTFIEKVEPRSIDLIDVDTFGTGVKVTLFDVLGRERIYSVPPRWTEDIAVNGPPGYRTLDLTSLLPQPGYQSIAVVKSPPDYLPGEVVRMEIALGGSGALDNLVFARENDPNTPLSGG
ncbi:MAG: hypothetical protein HOP15_04905, partial [Planctomycetes bacterium]|nr:hypothetical protein [Planctomycetota bacterium]